MSKKEEKTNVMRQLDQLGIEYECFTYDNTQTNAAEIAMSLGRLPGEVFKTLVTVGRSGEHYVFMIPSTSELDLKKAARAAGEKSISMIPQKELLPLTGYVHGGCSPIGMKKRFRTFIDTSALSYERILCSGGRVGHQVRLRTADLLKVAQITPAELV